MTTIIHLSLNVKLGLFLLFPFILQDKIITTVTFKMERRIMTTVLLVEW